MSPEKIAFQGRGDALMNFHKVETIKQCSQTYRIYLRKSWEILVKFWIAFQQFDLHPGQNIIVFVFLWEKMLAINWDKVSLISLFIC